MALQRQTGALRNFMAATHYRTQCIQHRIYVTFSGTYLLWESIIFLRCWVNYIPWHKRTQYVSQRGSCSCVLQKKRAAGGVSLIHSHGECEAKFVVAIALRARRQCYNGFLVPTATAHDIAAPVGCPARCTATHGKRLTGRS